MPTFRINRIRQQWAQAQKDLPLQMGRVAENHFKENFRQGGFVDDVLKPWVDRKMKDAGRAIMVKTGKLRRSIRAVPGGAGEVRIVSDTPYGKYHNDGVSPQPERKFIGPSKTLNLKLSNLIKRVARNAFKV